MGVADTQLVTGSSRILSLWHDIRFPVIIGATFCYVYWKYCFYQPRATVPPRGRREKNLKLPSSDYEDEDEDEEDNYRTNKTDKTVRLPKDDLESDQRSTVAVFDDTNIADTIKVSGTSSRKARNVKVFTRKSKLAKAENRLLPTQSEIYIFYSTLTGTCEKYAAALESALTTNPALKSRKVIAQNIDYLDDLDTYFVTPTKSLNDAVYLFVVPSYATESPLDFFIETLKETYNDFRIDSRPLRKLGGYAVFGLGDLEGYDGDEYCYQAFLLDKYLGKLGAPRAFPIGTGDVKNDAKQSFEEWIDHLSRTLADPASVGELLNIVDSDDEGAEEAQDEIETDIAQPASTVKLSKTTDSKEVVDVEDMGVIIENSKPNQVVKKEMVGKNTPTYNSLTKQGYTIVGSHSGVKVCRWTKSALRGRGSCYKFAFYGIRSHLCMETTPSLSCSNKCVFCWRHGTNPVGTTWRWQVDPPDVILKGALEGHYQKIKQMRGVPGVQAARFAEAFTVRHCALSLVGEPIFYPHINEFTSMLHERNISSFLVCNAQHPEQLRTLKRVTQLYVSIDASDKESLRRIDRPLHRDFWERFNECLDILHTKSEQRTVFRLTLVKGFNASEVLGYARLVLQARPCFVEVKGVTYCGTTSSPTGPGAAFKSGGSKDGLTMANVPFYEEVRDFVVQLNQAIKDLGLDYDIAAEHAHSCCILIAQKRFQLDGDWYTHIDYAKFFELLKSGAEFGPMDYIAKTPSWAQFGSAEAGFNPEDERVMHKRKTKLENVV
ncbi:hypothetical protein V1512DRAFT_260407 [Lipomyces arxii]|uniref:uncharacterized protein n=1 Tax=Lipomyces arxii TaxID=56418 RepID=UPI0034CD56C6